MDNRIMEINPRPSEVLELIDRMQKNRVDGPYTLISDDVDPVIIDDLKGPFSEADAVENVAKLLQIAEVEVRFLTEEQFNVGVLSPYALNDIIQVDGNRYKVVGWRKKARKRALVVETATGKVGHMMPRNPRTNELWDIVESGNKTNE